MRSKKKAFNSEIFLIQIFIDWNFIIFIWQKNVFATNYQNKLIKTKKLKILMLIFCIFWFYELVIEYEMNFDWIPRS